MSKILNFIPRTSDVLRETRDRQSAGKVAELFGHKTSVKTRAWMRDEPSDGNFASGIVSPFARLVKQFPFLLDRAKKHICAESDKTAFGLAGFAIYEMFRVRFWERGISISELERKRAALALVRDSAELARVEFCELSERQRVTRLLVRIFGHLAKIYLGNFSPEAAAIQMEAA
jgi:hypothetical protein